VICYCRPHLVAERLRSLLRLHLHLHLRMCLHLLLLLL
jgi:hypothetical protein